MLYNIVHHAYSFKTPIITNSFVYLTWLILVNFFPYKLEFFGKMRIYFLLIIKSLIDVVPCRKVALLSSVLHFAR